MGLVNAVHALVYCRDADKARAFFRDVLGWSHVDAGHGWLIFALPPAEIGVHPVDEPTESGNVELYLMCRDLEKTLAALKRKGVRIARPPADQGYGIVAAIEIPGGGAMGIYQPRHPLAWRAARRKPPKRARKAARPRARASRK